MSTTETLPAVSSDSTAASTHSPEGRKTHGPIRSAKGPVPITLKRLFTRPGASVFDDIRWVTTTAQISDDTGKPVFEQKNVEVPDFWSPLAINVVVSKYFRGGLGTPQRETSVKQLIGRVVNTITGWGEKQGYFKNEEDASIFRNELMYILVHQMACFNSPVWFNVGVKERPQASACFIISVEDSMESIMENAATESMLFKWGSGCGSDRSRLRSTKEKLSSGGKPSGPVSFMRGYDAFAGVVKSGGTTRRSAKMEILRCDHPDIMEFIKAKSKEEKKAWALIDAGYDGSFTGEAYSTVAFQNCNMSVRVTDEFMRRASDKQTYSTVAVTTKKPVEELNAADVLRAVAEGTHLCGDPGLQFDDTIQKWHTCPNTDRIHATNPCSEFVFLDDTACNLASINLMKFRYDQDGDFKLGDFRHVVRMMILAQEIIVDNASYPTDKIERNSRDYRPLGLGYAGLGALLMSYGMPYTGYNARVTAASITALMTAEAYVMSAEIAGWLGPFKGFEKNSEPMLRVMEQHWKSAENIKEKERPFPSLAEFIHSTACRAWNEAVVLGGSYGYANAQVTVLAPTGTIAFMMDCDTTGIEPDIALVKYKKIVGGGLLKIVNRTVPMALKNLGYSPDEIKEITDYIDREETIEGAPNLKPEHLPVFDCAFKPKKGTRSIGYMGHVGMMAACTPFLSGSISKTVNMPSDATVEDITQAYFAAWRLGVKAIAVYRDGSKRTQPLNTSKKQAVEGVASAVLADKEPMSDEEVSRVLAKLEQRHPGVLQNRKRVKLPSERNAINHRFSVGGHEGYITVGLYPDGRPGELFLTVNKEGSIVSGLMDTIAVLTSVALQYGIPLETFVRKFMYTRFEPAGPTDNPDIPTAKSLMDYVFRWMGRKFLPADAQPTGEEDSGVHKAVSVVAHGGNGNGNGHAAVKPLTKQEKMSRREQIVFENHSDAPVCIGCGSMMVRNGSCHTCSECGSSSGCS